MGEKAVDRLDVSEPRLGGFFAMVPIMHLGMSNTTIVLIEEFFSRGVPAF
jgi:hypothetical protein